MNRFSKKAAQGIGTLIIFIAMILVAAVAAGVLIQTSSSLQSKSLDVGRQAQERITSNVEIVQVYAVDTSDGYIDGGDDNISLVVRIGSGGSPVKLSDLLVKLDSSTTSQTLTNGGSVSETNFATTYSINGTSHQSGYIVEGDLATIEFTVDSTINITEGSSVVVRLVTKDGSVRPVDITTPSAMVQQTTYLYP